MLKLIVTIPERYDEINDMFIQERKPTLQLEHSLVSISKWESKWEVPFLGKQQQTAEQTIDYIKCMTITQCTDTEIYEYISNENITQVRKYIDATMTATVFSKNNTKINRETTTAEIIYYWMISLNIPFECQKWHLNRLLALINMCGIKNNPPKKMSNNELMSRNKEINDARRKAMNTNG